MPALPRLAARTHRASSAAASPNERLAEGVVSPRWTSAEETPDEPGEAPDPEPDADETPAAPGESPAPAPHPGTTPSEPGDAPADGARERNRRPSVDR